MNTKSTPAVTAVVTFHNNEEYVSECLNSIIFQTVKPLEIIIADDGSTDGTADICHSYMEKYSFISYYNVNGQGVSVARNTGIEHAKGEYVMFTDGDDRLHSNIIEHLLSEEEDGTDIVCCTCTAFCTEDGSESKCHFFSKAQDFCTADEKKELYKQLMNPQYGQDKNNVFTAIGVPWGKLYKTEFLRKYNLMFVPGLKRMQDNVFNMYAFNKAEKIRYTDQPLYGYRINHITNVNKAGNPPEIYMQILSHRRSFFAENPHMFTEDIEDGSVKESITFLMRSFKNISLTRDKKTAVADMKNLCKEDVYAEVLKGKLPSDISSKQKLAAGLAKMGLFKVLYFLVNRK